MRIRKIRSQISGLFLRRFDSDVGPRVPSGQDSGRNAHQAADSEVEDGLTPLALGALARQAAEDHVVLSVGPSVASAIC